MLTWIAELLREFYTQSPSGLCPEEEGLVSKLARTFMGLPPSSNFRYWLSSCVEAFCRNVEPACQLWIARSGLLTVHHFCSSYLIQVACT